MTIARRAVMHFRKRADTLVHSFSSEDEELLQRLESDGHRGGGGGEAVGRVSAAFARLVPLPILEDPSIWHNLWRESVTLPLNPNTEPLPRNPNTIIGWLIEAKGVAERGGIIREGTELAASELKRLADNARELAYETKALGFACEISDSASEQRKQEHDDASAIIESLPRIAELFDRARESLLATPDKLGINRKVSGSAAQIRALRLLFGYLKPTTTKEKEAVVWLIEAALDVRISKSQATEAFLDRKRGHSQAISRLNVQDNTTY